MAWRRDPICFLKACALTIEIDVEVGSSGYGYARLMGAESRAENGKILEKLFPPVLVAAIAGQKNEGEEDEEKERERERERG